MKELTKKMNKMKNKINIYHNRYQNLMKEKKELENIIIKQEID